MGKHVNGSVLLLSIFLAMCSHAYAVYPDWHTHQLQCITNNNSANAAAGENQLSFDIGTGDEWNNNSSMSFRFRNFGSSQMTVSRIVFDFPVGMRWIGGGMGDFHAGSLVYDFVASPQTALPGGNNIVPNFQNDFELYGVYGLKPGQGFFANFNFNVRTDTYDIENALRTGEFKVGFYVTGFANGGNESFASIPEPATIGLLALGGILLRKRKH